eukprot:10820808-Alexandrium_andersonii.AAC.1
MDIAPLALHQPCAACPACKLRAQTCQPVCYQHGALSAAASDCGCSGQQAIMQQAAAPRPAQPDQQHVLPTSCHAAGARHNHYGQ